MIVSKICFLLLWFAFSSAQVNNKNVPTLELTKGVEMPVVGYGTWNALDQELEKALNIALESGYRHIDTAYVYGNEKVIGKVLNDWFKSGKLSRKDIFLTTKLPNFGNRAEDVPKYMRKSLENLQVDYVDLYLIHAPYGFKSEAHRNELDFTTDHLKIWKAMEDQVDAGKTKTIGLSNFNQTQIERIMKNSRIKPTCLQNEIHAYYQEKSIVDYCKKNNIVVVAYSPLGSPGSAQFFEKNGQKIETIKLLQNPVINEIAKKHKKSAAQILLRHGVQRGLVVIPKSTNEKRMKENINIFDFVLDEEDMKKMNDLDIGKQVLDIKEVFPEALKHPEYSNV